MKKTTRGGTRPKKAERPAAPSTGANGERSTLREIDFEEASQLPTGEGAPAAIRSERGPPRLIVLTGNAVGEVFALERDRSTIGRSHTADIQVDDRNSSRQHCVLVRRDDEIWVEDLASTNGTFLNGERVQRPLQLHEGDKLQVGAGTIFRFSQPDRIEAEAHRQLYESALVDGLTHAYNKKYFLSRLDSEVAFSLRHGSLLSLVLFDIDHFKLVNDTHGHLAGDAVLAQMAALVARTVRKEDVFSRYGGEEFAVISRGIDLDGAVRFGERLRARVQAQPSSFQDLQIAITISVGVCELGSSGAHSGTELLACADRALYRAKAGGRNRVVIGER